VNKPLTRQQVAAVLDRWVGSDVTIRVVSEGHILLLVFQGKLGVRADSKHPALFWPLHASDQRDHFEQPGIYLHPHVFHEAVARDGDFVIELRQATTTLNIRRL
jgi:hypothetical protein